MMATTRRTTTAVTALRRSLGNHTQLRCMSGTLLHSSNVAGEDSTQVAYLHGLLGNGKNLTTMAKRFGGGQLIDLRGHGQSPSGSNPHTFESCASDVLTTVESLSPTTIVGHSFGGRVALECAVLSHEAGISSTTASTTKSTWLLDTVPGEANESVEKVLAAIQSVDPANYATRKDVAAGLQKEQQLDPGLSHWLASSMTIGKNEELQWGFDLSIVNALMPEFGSQDFLGKIEHVVLSEEGPPSTIHLVRGGKNTGWSVDIVSKLQELANRSKGRFHVHTLPKAGHWVHVDDLPGLVNLWTSYR